MIAIHPLDAYRSERIVRVMEELGLPYRLEVLERQPEIFAPEELKRIHKLGRAPVIRDDDIVVTGSGPTPGRMADQILETLLT